MIKFSISTSWNAMTAPNAIAMIKQIKRMGFSRVELNFTLTFKDICDIISIKDKVGIEITGLHNFCPIPEGTSPDKASPDYYSLSSLDEEERAKAVSATKVTIETARKLNAPVVILHSGRIRLKDRTKKLAAALNDKANCERVKQKMLDERAKYAPEYFSKTLTSIEELLDFAKKQNVVLGIENRFYYNEIPSVDEMVTLLDRFNDSHIGYWHDVGHAQIFENIGLYDHKKDYLDRLAPRMIGVHLHDVAGIDDHRAPLKGDFDFSMLKPYIKKDTFLVLEPHYPATTRDIKRGAKYLAKLFKGVQ